MNLKSNVMRGKHIFHEHFEFCRAKASINDLCHDFVFPIYGGIECLTFKGSWEILHMDFDCCEECKATFYRIIAKTANGLIGGICVEFHD